MEVKQVTTLGVAARGSFVSEMSKAFAGAGTIEQQPYFKPVARRDLMAAVNTAAGDLGLRPTSVMVLDALLSCLPCNDPRAKMEVPISPLLLLTVFACNETLCFRAKGITDRQLRRHLERLEEVGLIRRRDSANGKRFPVKRGGKVIAAFGIDISPLLARSDEILSLAEVKRHEADELRGLKANIQALRQRCMAIAVSEEPSAFLQGLRNVLRRAAMTLHEARSVISRLDAVLSEANTRSADNTVPPKTMVISKENPPTDQLNFPPANTQMPATAGQNVRHKDTPKSDSKKEEVIDPDSLWNNMKTIPDF